MSLTDLQTVARTAPEWAVALAYLGTVVVGVGLLVSLATRLSVARSRSRRVQARAHDRLYEAQVLRREGGIAGDQLRRRRAELFAPVADRHLAA